MRRTCVLRTCARVLRQIFAIKKKSDPPLRTGEGREAKAYMRNGFTAEFCHFLGTIWSNITVNKLDPYDFKEGTKKLFLCGKICKFFEEKKNVIKKKTKKLFSVENNSKSFERKKKRTEKNANYVLRTCAGVSQRTRKRMSYGGGSSLYIYSVWCFFLESDTHRKLFWKDRHTILYVTRTGKKHRTP